MVQPASGAYEMRVRVGDAECPLGHPFPWYSLGDMAYGYMLARTPNATALVRAIEDPVFEQVSTIVKDLEPDMDPSDRAELVWRAFGAACDPDEHGAPFVLGAIPCPTCGREAADYRLPADAPMEPAPAVVEHRRWLATDVDSRRELVVRALRGPSS